MLPEYDSDIEFLKQVLIFNEFDEDELEQIACLLNTEFVQAGEVIFSQGDDRDHMYLVLDGEVQLRRDEKDGKVSFQAYLHSGDLFGEDALYYHRHQSATATAATDAELRYLSEDNFNWLRNTFPKVEPYFNAFNRTHEITRKLKIKWLNEGETINLVNRRHPISMIVELLLILFLVFFILTISIALTTFIKDVFLITVISAGFAGIVTVFGLIAGISIYYEWHNDYFFVTNLRVVWRERILFRASSRQEVPLRRIQSLDVETSNFFERLLQIGNVIIRTFNSEMRLTHVYHPDRMKNMVDAFMKQAQRRFIRSEQAAIRHTIRHKLGVPQEKHPVESKSPSLPIPKEPKHLSIFNTRIVEDNTITYRKHWWVFFKGAWKSTLALLFSIFFVIFMSGFVFQFFGLGVLLLSFLLPFVIFFWWLYAYADWRNDIYIITKDRIIDRDKKPFGKESFRSAPIQNIQSVGHEIPNVIGLLMKVGNVRINVGEEILTFDGVYDPALVHQDISRHMEEFAANLEKDRIKQEHAHMATWLDIYHDETRNEINKSPTKHIPDFD